MDRKKKKLLLGISLIFLPGAGIVFGSILLYRMIKKKPKTMKEFIESVKREAYEEDNKKTSNRTV